MTCQFYNTYILERNGVPQGQYCAMYNETWNATYATNVGQYDSKGNHYTISYSYTASNASSAGVCVDPNNGAKTCPTGYGITKCPHVVGNCYCWQAVTGIAMLGSSPLCSTSPTCVSNSDCPWGSFCTTTSCCLNGGTGICIASPQSCPNPSDKRAIFARDDASAYESADVATITARDGDKWPTKQLIEERDGIAA